jgi:putative flippase GtrA
MPSPPETTSDGRGRPLLAKLLRYAGGSLVATVSSEAAFVLVYGVLHAPTVWASALGWLAGAIPNYWLNRRWTWRRTERPSFRGEIVPYVAIIGLTLLLATLATGAADAALRGADVSASVRTLLVAGVFLGVYVVVFALRFLMLDRLFTRLEAADEGRPLTTTRRGTT